MLFITKNAKNDDFWLIEILINKKDKIYNKLDFEKFDVVILNKEFDIIIKVFIDTIVNIIVDVDCNVK